MGLCHGLIPVELTWFALCVAVCRDCLYHLRGRLQAGCFAGGSNSGVMLCGHLQVVWQPHEAVPVCCTAPSGTHPPCRPCQVCNAPTQLFTAGQVWTDFQVTCMHHLRKCSRCNADLLLLDTKEAVLLPMALLFTSGAAGAVQMVL